jgi:hypothetical protein
LFTEDDLVPFVVMDIELITQHNTPHSGKSNSKIKHRYNKSGAVSANGEGVSDEQIAPIAPANDAHKFYAQLAEVWVMKESDLGVVEDMGTVSYHCYSHLGHTLQAGDVVMGYDLRHSTTIAFASNQYEDIDDEGSVSTQSHKKSASNADKRTKNNRGQAPTCVDLLCKLSYDIPDVVLVHKLSAKQANNVNRTSSKSDKRQQRKQQKHASMSSNNAQSAGATDANNKSSDSDSEGEEGDDIAFDDIDSYFNEVDATEDGSAGNDVNNGVGGPIEEHDPALPVSVFTGAVTLNASP